MQKIIFTVGTRPEAIKICPLIKEMRSRGKNVLLVSTHQHRELLTDALRAFELSPDCELPFVDYPSLELMREGIKAALCEIFVREKPDAVAVHGDTTSALASAQAARALGIPVFHIEAGLRSGDLSSPYPEEYNRVTIDSLSSLFFAPTDDAKENLLCEGVDRSRIFVTGNTGIDALAFTVKEDFSHPLLDRARDKTLIFLTCHRRENQGERMKAIFSSIAAVLSGREDCLCVFPMHPSPAVREAAAVLEGCENVVLCEPFDPITAHNLLARASLILTDSGGIQEEAAALHIPTLVLRDKTERGEGIKSGALMLAGTDPEKISRTLSHYLDCPDERAKMAESANPFGDGRASSRIADAIEKCFFEKRDVLGLMVADISPDGALTRAVDLAKSKKFARIATVNAEIAWKCSQDRDFMQNINSSDLIIADGQGVVDGARLCGSPIVNGKCAGIDLAMALLKEKDADLSFFFLGAKREVVSAAAEKARSEYGAAVTGFCDGYFEKSPAGSRSVIEQIKHSAPNVVFVCLGAPLQEEWIYENRALLPDALYIGLGGTLDVLSGCVRRAPKFFVSLHLEWLWRLLSSPRRLGRMSVIPKYLRLCRKSKKKHERK